MPDCENCWLSNTKSCPERKAGDCDFFLSRKEWKEVKDPVKIFSEFNRAAFTGDKNE